MLSCWLTESIKNSSLTSGMWKPNYSWKLIFVKGMSGHSLYFIHSFIPFCPTPLAFQGYCPTTHCTIFPCQCQILIKNSNNKKHCLVTTTKKHSEPQESSQRAPIIEDPSSLLLDNLVLLVSWKMLLKLYLNHRFSFFIFQYQNLCVIFIRESDAYT